MPSDFNQSGHADCPLCAGEVSADFAKTIAAAAAAATTSAEMTPSAFQAWLYDEARKSDL